MDIAGERKRCCVSVEAETRAHPDSKVLWLVSVVTTLPVVRSYVRSMTIVRAHQCLMLRAGKLSAGTFSSFFVTCHGQRYFRILLRLFLLPRSLKVLRLAPVGQTNHIAGSACWVFGLFVTCSRHQKLLPTAVGLEYRLMRSLTAFRSVYKESDRRAALRRSTEACYCRYHFVW